MNINDNHDEMIEAGLNIYDHVKERDYKFNAQACDIAHEIVMSLATSKEMQRLQFFIKHEDAENGMEAEFDVINNIVLPLLEKLRNV